MMINMNNLKKVKSSIINMINVELTKENRLNDVSSIMLKIKFECSDVCSLYPLTWLEDPYDEFIIEHFINRLSEPYRDHLIGFKLDDFDTWVPVFDDEETNQKFIDETNAYLNKKAEILAKWNMCD